MITRVTIYEDICNGCGLCTTACPKKILVMGSHMNSKGYHPVTIIDQSLCISCAMCARMCPDCAIKVEK